MISCSQFVHRFEKSYKGCSALHPNWKDDLSWPSGWGSHGECSSVYGYTLNMTYNES